MRFAEHGLGGDARSHGVQRHPHFAQHGRLANTAESCLLSRVLCQTRQQLGGEQGAGGEANGAGDEGGSTEGR